MPNLNIGEQVHAAANYLGDHFKELATIGTLSVASFVGIGQVGAAESGPRTDAAPAAEGSTDSNGNFIVSIADGNCLADPYTYAGSLSYAEPISGEVEVIVNGIEADAQTDPSHYNTFYSTPVVSIPSGGMDVEIKVGAPDGIDYEATMSAEGCEVPPETTTTTEATTSSTTTTVEATTTTSTSSTTTTPESSTTTTETPTTSSTTTSSTSTVPSQSTTTSIEGTTTTNSSGSTNEPGTTETTHKHSPKTYENSPSSAAPARPVVVQPTFVG